MLRMDPSLLITRIVTLLIAFTCHEFSHALAAVLLGDDTPKRDGRLSLNPLRHLDPWGSLLLIFAGFGWAKPVRVDPYAVTRLLLRSGIVPNVQPFGLSWMPRTIYALRQFIMINLSLLVFNLVPLRPLDGEKVLGYFIPSSFRGTWSRIQSYGQQILMLCFFLLPYLNINFAHDLVSGIAFSLYRMLTGGY